MKITDYIGEYHGNETKTQPYASIEMHNKIIIHKYLLSFDIFVLPKLLFRYITQWRKFNSSYLHYTSYLELEDNHKSIYVYEEGFVELNNNQLLFYPIFTQKERVEPAQEKYGGKPVQFDFDFHKGTKKGIAYNIDSIEELKSEKYIYKRKSSFTSWFNVIKARWNLKIKE